MRGGVRASGLPDSRLRLGLALVLGSTVFGSLWAIADEGPKWAALAVTVGLAVSLIPILLRVLPPLAKDAATNKRDPDYGITVLGLILYVAVVAGFLVLLDIDERARPHISLATVHSGRKAVRISLSRRTSFPLSGRADVSRRPPASSNLRA